MSTRKMSKKNGSSRTSATKGGIHTTRTGKLPHHAPSRAVFPQARQRYNASSQCHIIPHLGIKHRLTRRAEGVGVGPLTAQDTPIRPPAGGQGRQRRTGISNQRPEENATSVVRYLITRTPSRSFNHNPEPKSCRGPKNIVTRGVTPNLGTGP